MDHTLRMKVAYGVYTLGEIIKKLKFEVLLEKRSSRRAWREVARLKCENKKLADECERMGRTIMLCNLRHYQLTIGAEVLPGRFVMGSFRVSD